MFVKKEGPLSMERAALYIIAHSLIVWFCVIMTLAGFAPFLNGFGVDTQGDVYVGDGRMIRVYRDGQQVRTIELRDSTYELTVNEHDELVVAYNSSVEWRDTTGNVLKKAPKSDLGTLPKAGAKVTAANGDVYKRIHYFGWTRIVRNGTEVVYRMRLLSVAVKFGYYLFAVLMFVNIPRIIIRGRKNPDLNPWSADR